MFKKEKLKVAKVDLDQDLEIPEFDFDMPPPKDDRKPVKKVLDGAIAGAKSSLFSKETLFKTMKTALPDGFGEAVSVAEQVNQGARKIYNDAANQIKPSLNEMSRAAAKLVPSEKAKTKAALDSVAKWSESTSSKYSSNDQASQREAGLDLTLNEVFKFQAEQSIKLNAENNVKEKIQASLEINRHKDTFGLLNNINLNTSRLSQYQERVTNAFQKKSLEIQYRSYFVAMDVLEETKKQNAITKLSLESIAKNTALPEFVKLTKHESFKENARNKFWGSVNNGLFGGRNNIIGKISENIGTVVRDKLSSAAEAFSMGTMVLEGLETQKEMSDSMGMNAPGGGEMAGNMAAGMGVDWLAGKFGKWVKKQADKNETISKANRKVGSFARNVPQHLNEFKKSGKGEWDNPDDDWKTKILNFVMRTSKSFIPGMGVDDSVQSDKADTLTAPYHFTKQTHKSINEVIPGYLSRIFRELQVLRTGDTKTELTTYDFVNNKFTGMKDAAKSAIKSVMGKSDDAVEKLIRDIDKDNQLKPEAREALRKKIMKDRKDGKSFNLQSYLDQNEYSDPNLRKHYGSIKSVFKEHFKLDKDDHRENYNDFDAEQREQEFKNVYQRSSDKTYTQEQIERILNRLDPDGTKLDQKSRDVLSKKLLSDNFDTRLGTSKRLTDKDTFAEEDTKQYAELFANTFKEYFSLNKDNEELLNTDYNRLGTSMNDPRGFIQNLINLEQYDLLKSTGLINDDASKIDLKKLQRLHLGEEAVIKDENELTANAGGLNAQSLEPLIEVTRSGFDKVSYLLELILDKTGSTTATSDIRMKKDFKPVAGDFALNAIRSTPVTKWNYKNGAGDGGAHIGPMAQTVNQTMGNDAAPGGTKIDLVTMNGMTMSAIQELDKKQQEQNKNYTLNPKKDKEQELLDLIKDVGLITNTKLEEIKLALLTSGGMGGYKNDGSVLGSLKTLGKAGADMATSLIKGGHKMTKGFVGLIPFNKGKELIGTAAKGAKEFADFGLDKLRNLTKIRDVFIAGEIEPRINETKLRAGKYFLEDENGNRKVITDITQITGRIVDETGKTVIAIDELGKMFTKNIKAKGFVKFVTKVGKWTFDTGNKYSKMMLSLIPPALRSAKDFLMSAKKFAFDLIDEPVDIFVRGNPTAVMIARIMKNGGYISQKTQKVILHPSEIDGPVLYEGKIILTLEDIQKGLVDSSGNPIRLPMQKIKDFASNLLKKTIEFGKSVSSKAIDLAKKGAHAVGTLVTGGLNGLMNGTQSFANGIIKDNSHLLIQIRDLLNTRLPGRRTKFNDNAQAIGKTKVDSKGLDKNFNDTDGDGTREGSWKTMGKKTKDKATDAKNSIVGKVSDKLGHGDEKPGVVSKLFDKLMGIKSQEEVAKDSLDTLKDMRNIMVAQAAGGGVGDLLGNGGKAGKAAGRFGKLGKLAKYGGKALGAAGAAYGAYSAYDNVKKGNYGDAAVDGALAVGSGALAYGGLGALGTVAGAAGSAALTAGGVALTGAGALAAGVGGLLASPVVLGALAIGALGAAGYVGYKYFTKSKEMLTMLRYVQYGFDKNDTQYMSQIRQLESILSARNVKFESGVAKLIDKDFDIAKALSIFGVSQDNEKDFNKWISWFTGRFKPIFLTHLTTLQGIDPKIRLPDVESLKPDQKLDYFRKASFSEGPYDYCDSPIAGMDQLPSGSKEVKQMIADVEKNLKKDVKTDKASIATTTSKEKENNTTKQLDVPKPTNIDPEIKKTGGILSLVSDSLGKAMAVTPLFAVGVAVGRFFGYNATSLETIRFKTYGLKTLERSKVSALRSLEEIVFKDVKFNSNGGADWSSNAEILIRYAGKDFGVDSASSDAAKPWMNWFTKRFLPVYLAYLGLLKQTTGKEEQKTAEQSLKPSQELDIATKISATNNVWSITESPWGDYKLSTDIKDVAENLALMKEKSEKDEMVDAKKTISNQNSKSATLGSSPMKQSNPELKKAIDDKGKPVGPADGETPVSGTGGNSSKSTTTSNAPKAAEGPLMEGTHANQYIKLAPGVSLSGMNPDLMKNFNGMVEEYGTKTGNTVYVNSGFRSYTQQQALFKKDPKKAAKPGGSLHEYGLALDVSSSTLDELDKMGLMAKYGFTRPVGGETWHMEPAGIGLNVAQAKNDTNFASQVIMASLGRGGGGYGATKSSPMGKRNNELAKQIFESGTTPQSNTSTAVASSNQPATTSEVVAQAVSKQPSKGYSNSTNKGSIVSPDAESGKVEDFKTTVAGSSGAMTKIPDAGPGKGLEAVRPTIEGAAKATGVDPNLMLGMAGIESSFDPNAKAKTSSASGLYQFTDGTWNEMVSKHGEKYGISPDTSPMNAKANALMGGEYLKTNMKIISKSKPDPSNTDLYMAHFLGGSGANKLFSADPNAPAANVLPKAAASNKSIFYNGGAPRTTNEVYSLMDNKVNKTLNNLGLKSEPSKPIVKPPSNIINPAATTPVGLSDSLGQNESIAPPVSGLRNAMTSNTSPVGFNDQVATNQPQQDSRYDMNKAIGGVSDTLKQSLTVQTNMYDVLKDILKVVNPTAIANAMKEAGVSNPAQKPETDTPASNSTRSNIGQQGPRSVRSVPVPMSRTQT